MAAPSESVGAEAVAPIGRSADQILGHHDYRAGTHVCFNVTSNVSRPDDVAGLRQFITERWDFQQRNMATKSELTILDGLGMLFFAQILP